VLDHLGAPVVADQIRIPVSRCQQPLHAIRGALAGVLGQLPAILAPHLAEQATQIRQHPSAWFARANRPPIRVCRASSPAAQARTSSMSAAASLTSGTSLALLALGAAGDIPAGGREPYPMTSAVGVLMWSGLSRRLFPWSVA
jgi:hypothetical protein